MSKRRDAGRGACLAITRAFDTMVSSDMDESGRMTFGAIEFMPGATNVVPGESVVASEVRGRNAEHIGQLRNIVDQAFRGVAADFGLDLIEEAHEIDEPANLSPMIMEVIQKAAADAKIPIAILPSGACHDAQTFSTKVPTGMIFVSSQNGVSHHRDEFTEPEAIVKGVTVLLGSLQQLLAGAGKLPSAVQRAGAGG